MTRITHIEVLDNFKIKFEFNDATEKIVDFTQFIGDDVLTRPLSDPEYFRQVQVFENGRGIYWPNGYDVCPDYLRNYVDEVEPAMEDHSERNLH